MDEDRNSKEYWDWRVKSHLSNEQRMIWYGQDWKHAALDLVTDHILTMFAGGTALDLGCGFGRWAHKFEPGKYLGLDFSDEMIKLAKSKFPDYQFKVGDIKTFVPDKKYDIIFEVMSAVDFALDHKGYIEKYGPFANVAIVCIHPSETLIHFKDLA